MKIKLLFHILVCIVNTNLFANFMNAEAFTKPRQYPTFFCRLIGDVPNTVARINYSDSYKIVPVIRWSLSEYADSEETPVQRCVRVSAILQNQRFEQGHNNVSSATQNGKQVICVISPNSYSCNLTIFTLESNENSKEIVNDLRQIIAKPELLDPANNNIVQKRWNTQSYGRNIRAIDR